MRFKVYYQKNNKQQTIILDKDQIDNFQFDIIKVEPIRDKLDILKLDYRKVDTLFMFKQLNSMLKANLNFNEAIKLLNSSEENRTIKKILNTIDNTLKSNDNIEKSLKPYKNYIANNSILFLKLGFENGNLKDAIDSIVTIQTQEQIIREKFRKTLSYPILLIATLFISFFIIFIYVVPNFEHIFLTLGENLPYSTKILLILKDIILNYYYLLFIFLLLLIFTTLALYKKHKIIFDKILLQNIPLLSYIIKSYLMFKLFLSLYIIVNSKYQFQIAIENSKNSIDNLYLKNIIQKIILDIKNGTSIAKAFSNSGFFDQLTIKLLYTAQNTNNYRDILNDIKEYHNTEFNEKIEKLSKLIEPLVISIIALIVLWLILAIMVPVWQMGSMI